MTRTTRAVSPVIAVILMVAVTVVLSAAVGAFVFDLGQGLDESDSQSIGVRTTAEDTNLSVQVITGTADELKLLINGTVVDNTTNVHPGDRLSALATSNADVAVVAVNNGKERVITTQNPMPDGLGPLAPTKGLIAHYKFETGSGSTAYDSASTNDGTLDNSTWSGSSKVGTYAMAFDGSWDSVDLGQNTFDSTTAYTLATWVKLNPLDASSRQKFIDLEALNYLVYSDGVLRFSHWDDTASTSVQIDGPSPTTETWYHVVGTYDGSSINLYVNGNRVNSTSSVDPSNRPGYNRASAIGAQHDGSSSHLDGYTDDVRVYNRSLNGSEVKTLYDATK